MTPRLSVDGTCPCTPDKTRCISIKNRGRCASADPLHSNKNRRFCATARGKSLDDETVSVLLTKSCCLTISNKVGGSIVLFKFPGRRQHETPVTGILPPPSSSLLLLLLPFNLLLFLLLLILFLLLLLLGVATRRAILWATSISVRPL